MGWPTGLEPATFGATIRCSAIELRPPSRPGRRVRGGRRPMGRGRVYRTSGWGRAPPRAMASPGRSPTDCGVGHDAPLVPRTGPGGTIAEGIGALPGHTVITDPGPRRVPCETQHLHEPVLVLSLPRCVRPAVPAHRPRPGPGRDARLLGRPLHRPHGPRLGREHHQLRVRVAADHPAEPGPGIRRLEGPQARHGAAYDRPLAEQGHGSTGLLLAHHPELGDRPQRVLVHAARVRLLLQGRRREHRPGNLAGRIRGRRDRVRLRPVHGLVRPPRQHHGPGVGRRGRWGLPDHR